MRSARRSISNSGRVDQFVDAGRVVRRVGMVGEILQTVAHAVVDLLAGLGDLRRVEQAEPQITGDVADHRVAHLRGDDQPVQYLADRTGRRGGNVVSAEPAPQQCADHRYRGSPSAAAPGTAGTPPLPARVRAPGGDVVVAQRASEPGPERLGQPLHLDVEGMQVRVEVLARAVHALVGILLVQVGRLRDSSQMSAKVSSSPISASTSSWSSTRQLRDEGRRTSPAATRARSPLTS